jgi:beta-lactamase class D
MARMSRLVLLLLAACLTPGLASARDLARHFKGIDGTFVLLDGQNGAYTRWNAPRAARRFAPCSTFKIPNTAILLETGAAPDPEFVVKYEPAWNASREAWRHDHTLRTAYRDSVLWYYHALARKAGLEAVTRWVKQFGYGNTDTSGGVAGPRPFWIDGTLEKRPGVCYFALQMGDKDYETVMPLRITKARAILADLGVIPVTEARP